MAESNKDKEEREGGDGDMSNETFERILRSVHEQRESGNTTNKRKSVQRILGKLLHDVQAGLISLPKMQELQKTLLRWRKECREERRSMKSGLSGMGLDVDTKPDNNTLRTGSCNASKRSVASDTSKQRHESKTSGCSLEVSDAVRCENVSLAKHRKSSVTQELVRQEAHNSEVAATSSLSNEAVDVVGHLLRSIRSVVDKYTRRSDVVLPSKASSYPVLKHHASATAKRSQSEYVKISEIMREKTEAVKDVIRSDIVLHRSLSMDQADKIITCVMDSILKTMMNEAKPGESLESFLNTSIDENFKYDNIDSLIPFDNKPDDRYLSVDTRGLFTNKDSLLPAASLQEFSDKCAQIEDGSEGMVFMGYNAHQNVEDANEIVDNKEASGTRSGNNISDSSKASDVLNDAVQDVQEISDVRFGLQPEEECETKVIKEHMDKYVTGESDKSRTTSACTTLNSTDRANVIVDDLVETLRSYSYMDQTSAVTQVEGNLEQLGDMADIKPREVVSDQIEKLSVLSNSVASSTKADIIVDDLLETLKSYRVREQVSAGTQTDDNPEEMSPRTECFNIPESARGDNEIAPAMSFSSTLAFSQRADAVVVDIIDGFKTPATSGELKTGTNSSRDSIGLSTKEIEDVDAMADFLEKMTDGTDLHPLDMIGRFVEALAVKSDTDIDSIMENFIGTQSNVDPTLLPSLIANGTLASLIQTNDETVQTSDDVSEEKAVMLNDGVLLSSTSLSPLDLDNKTDDNNLLPDKENRDLNTQLSNAGGMVPSDHSVDWVHDSLVDPTSTRLNGNLAVIPYGSRTVIPYSSRTEIPYAEHLTPNDRDSSSDNTPPVDEFLTKGQPERPNCVVSSDMFLVKKPSLPAAEYSGDIDTIPSGSKPVPPKGLLDSNLKTSSDSYDAKSSTPEEKTQTSTEMSDAVTVEDSRQHLQSDTSMYFNRTLSPIPTTPPNVTLSGTPIMKINMLPLKLSPLVTSSPPPEPFNERAHRVSDIVFSDLCAAAIESGLVDLDTKMAYLQSITSLGMDGLADQFSRNTTSGLDFTNHDDRKAITFGFLSRILKEVFPELETKTTDAIAGACVDHTAGHVYDSTH